jgi:hypothetical protein
MHPTLEINAEFPLPGIISLDLAIDRREHTANYLTQWQIAFDEMPDGNLVVPASEASGAILFFSEA